MIDVNKLRTAANGAHVTFGDGGGVVVSAYELTALLDMLEAAQKDAMAANAKFFELRKLLDERPAMNAGLALAYQAWSGKVYSLDFMNAIDSVIDEGGK